MTNELAATNNAVALSAEDQEIMEYLKSASGENDNQKFTSIPHLTIDNSMVELEVEQNGVKRKIKTRCEGAFVINSKEGEEYKKELFADKFTAVVMAYRHRVQRKPLFDQQSNNINKIPYFRSYEFKSFKSPIVLRMNGENSQPMTYQEIKDFANGEHELWGVIYLMIEGEDFVRKLEVKGASRGDFFDYLTQRRDSSISSFYTDFSVEILNDVANPYNKLVVKKSDVALPSLKEVAIRMKELISIIDTDIKPMKKIEVGEVINNSTVNNDKLLEKINDVSVEELFEEQK